MYLWSWLTRRLSTNNNNRFKQCLLFVISQLISVVVMAQDVPNSPPEGESERQLIREQQRQQRLQKQHQAPDIHLDSSALALPLDNLPKDESPCFVIQEFDLVGKGAEDFRWALNAVINPIQHNIVIEQEDDMPDTEMSHNNSPSLLGRCLGAKSINIIMRRVQNTLLKAGYITSRIVAGPQDLTSGRLELTLVPGRIKQIRFTDTDATPAFNALPMSAGDNLNLRDIEQALENLKRLPSVEADIKITPSTTPSAQAGDSDLLIEWQQTSPLRLSASLDNSGTKATGRYQGGLALAYDNPLGLHDIVNLSLYQDVGGGDPGAGGTESYALHYSIPYGNWLVSVNSSEYDYFQTVAGAFQSYRYSGESHSSSLSLSRRLYRDQTRKLSATLKGWLRHSKNFIDDTEVQPQRRRTAGLEAIFNYRQFIKVATINGSLTYRRGTGAFNAQPALEEAFGEGTSRPSIIKADLQLSLPFTLKGRRFHYSGYWRRQHNRSLRLVAQDNFSIGGRYTVRGFDGESSLSAERGWLVRNDISTSIFNPQHSLYLGVDYGQVAGFSEQFLVGDHLAGAVLGIKGQLSKLHYNLYVGQPINKPEGFVTASWVTQFSLNWVF